MIILIISEDAWDDRTNRQDDHPNGSNNHHDHRNEKGDRPVRTGRGMGDSLT